MHYLPLSAYIYGSKEERCMSGIFILEILPFTIPYIDSSYKNPVETYNFFETRNSFLSALSNFIYRYISCWISHFYSLGIKRIL